MGILLGLGAGVFNVFTFIVVIDSIALIVLFSGFKRPKKQETGEKGDLGKCFLRL